ncbi:MAG: O-methyltransferase [Myxococcales bacterium]|nr:O-methyltransferase [Polyangiaceae bacterium]MDW8249272.1 O-methyltransferase [Myxococcales bacterium]
MADVDSRTGTSYLTRPILDYLAATHVPHDEGLARAFTAPCREGLPAIQVGPLEGKLLALLLRLAGAKKVVEVGTLAGYSALHLARALPPDGHLWTIEVDENHARVARENLAAAGMSHRVTVVQGVGLEVLPTLEPHGPFDAVFIDADKVNYDRYGRWAACNLRPGGLLLGDNAVYFGRLLAEEEAAPAMRRFHEEAAVQFDTVCIPTPDGLLLGIKR